MRSRERLLNDGRPAGACGSLSPYFVTKPERMEAIIEDAYILINEKKRWMGLRHGEAPGASIVRKDRDKLLARA